MSKNRFGSGNGLGASLSSIDIGRQRGLLIGLILFVALIAFEIFNFDTTQFALKSLLGEVTFIGIHWATILAIAFCAIDFAGLNRLFSPDGDSQASREAWYLMGAWLLGATMNAVMTWWAVSVTLLNNSFGNEVLSREQLLRYVPIFVAVLVWLTRILFIGSLSIAGAHLFNSKRRRSRSVRSSTSGRTTSSAKPRKQTSPSRLKAAPKMKNPAVAEPTFVAPQPTSVNRAPSPQARPSRVRQRPPIPNGGASRNSGRIQASRRN
ncbi:MAG: hypothetical protein R3293_03165 [Candidatus Promineifilaceae bacterium]|nr:hypothetical protein [Candidatus Promineifilaceae bacterium]